jgi:dihydropteroate synthase
LDAGQFDSWLRDPRRLPLVMGVLNITPDSFSDGGRFHGIADAVDAASAMADAGADFVDIGGESTRPGATPVPVEEQIRRVQPVIAAIRRELPIALSIDTTQWTVAAAALDAGADIVNDISAGRDDGRMFPNIAQRQVPILLMHMRGTPKTMQDNPTYQDVSADIRLFLTQRLQEAQSAGIARHRILLDPGIGFGKTTAHDLAILRDLTQFAAIGQPVVIGASRKKFIGSVLNQPDPMQRIFGHAAVISWAVANGASVVRVHDVGPMRQVVKMICSIRHP